MKIKTKTLLARCVLIAALAIAASTSYAAPCGNSVRTSAVAKRVTEAAQASYAREVAMYQTNEDALKQEIEAETSCTISTLSALVSSLIPRGLFGLIDMIMNFDINALISGAIDSLGSAFGGDLACRIANGVTGAVTRSVNTTVNNAVGNITTPINGVINNTNGQINNFTGQVNAVTGVGAVNPNIQPIAVPTTVPPSPANNATPASGNFLSNLACKVLNRC